MAIFNFGEEEPEERISPMRHYFNCVEAFHQVAQEEGYVTKAPIHVPELLLWGEQVIISRLRSKTYTSLMRTNKRYHWLVINTEALQLGILFGYAWHKNFDDLQNSLLRKVMKTGPAPYLEPIFTGPLPIPPDSFKTLSFIIFHEWEQQKASLRKFRKTENPSPYTLKAILASFQLGVSMILEKLGH